MTRVYPIRKKLWGFHKQRTKVRYIANVDMRAALEIEDGCEITGLGQGTYAAKVLEIVMKNEDWRRVVLQMIQRDPETPNMAALSAEHKRQYKESSRVHFTFCQNCLLKIPRTGLAAHLAVCEKKPKLPAIPLMDMEKRTK